MREAKIGQDERSKIGQDERSEDKPREAKGTKINN